MTTDTTPTATQHTSASGYDVGPLPQAEIERLAARLDPEERRVLLDHGTERPFCGGLLDNHEEGAYQCRLCGLPLFRSSHKFDSGTGWPSFCWRSRSWPGTSTEVARAPFGSMPYSVRQRFHDFATCGATDVRCSPRTARMMRDACLTTIEESPI